MKKCHFLTKIRWNSSLFVIIRIHSLWFKHIRAYSALQKHISFINLKTNWYLMVVCPKIKILNFWPLDGAKPFFLLHLVKRMKLHRYVKFHRKIWSGSAVSIFSENPVATLTMTHFKVGIIGCDITCRVDTIRPVTV